MESILLVIHVVIALVIVGLILLQQGKGAEMGASFGAGSTQTIFGAAGSGNFFSRLTAVLAAVFFATSFSLAYLAQQDIGLRDFDVPVLETIDPFPAGQPDGAIPEVPPSPPVGTDEVPTAD